MPVLREGDAAGRLALPGLLDAATEQSGGHQGAVRSVRAEPEPAQAVDLSVRGFTTAEVVVDARTRWAVWLGATLASFLALEARALKQPLTDEKPSETLSAALRWWLGIQPAGRRRWVAGSLFAGFWLWLCLHVLAGVGPNDLPRRRDAVRPDAHR